MMKGDISKPITFRPDNPALASALDRLAGREHRSRSNMIDVMLQERLEREGLWPPADDHGKA